MLKSRVFLGQVLCGDSSVIEGAFKWNNCKQSGEEGRPGAAKETDFQQSVALLSEIFLLSPTLLCLPASPPHIVPPPPMMYSMVFSMLQQLLIIQNILLSPSTCFQT